MMAWSATHPSRPHKRTFCFCKSARCGRWVFRPCVVMADEAKLDMSLDDITNQRRRKGPSARVKARWVLVSAAMQGWLR